MAIGDLLLHESVIGTVFEIVQVGRQGHADCGWCVR